MKIDDCTLEGVHTIGGGETPPSVGLTSDALPDTQTKKEERTISGVSTRYAPSAKTSNTNIAEKPNNILTKPIPPKHPEETQQWYALRTTYGREKKAYDYMVAKGITAFYPTQNKIKIVKGKRQTIKESLIPNIFFAYGTFEQIKSFVYDNINLPFLRFYYCHTHVGCKIEKSPLIVPNYQMDSLKIICDADNANTIISLSSVPKFDKGQLVRIIEGSFQGVVGKVARYQGQQRVAVVVDNLITVVTAYVPSAFIEIIKNNSLSGY